MRRDGTDPDDVQPEDVLCDFCLATAWAKGVPCIEGHHGSIICGDCLGAAYASHDRLSGPPTHCTMCLETREEAGWQRDGSDAFICGRCIRQGAGALHKSKDWDWSKPES